MISDNIENLQERGASLFNTPNPTELQADVKKLSISNESEAIINTNNSNEEPSESDLFAPQIIKANISGH